MLVARRDAHQPVAVAHVVIRQAEFFRAKQQRDRTRRFRDQPAAHFEPVQRMLQRTMTLRSRADHQRAIGDGFGDGREFTRGFEHRVRFHRRLRFAKRDLVGIDCRTSFYHICQINKFV